MPAERVAMRVVREVLHLMFAGISKRKVARRTSLASSTDVGNGARISILHFGRLESVSLFEYSKGL
jgi:hypothetical protein